MNALSKFLKRSVIVLAIAPFALQATPIPSEVSVSGVVEFATGFSGSVSFSGDGSQSGTMSSTLDGVTETSIVTDIGVSGDSPRGGAFARIGDGVEVTTEVEGRSNSEADDFIFDIRLDLANNSLTDTFRFIFELTFDNQTSAFGSDAYIDSEINVFDSGNNELFASDLTTDTFFGDSTSRGPTGTTGETQFESDIFDFVFDLDAGASDFFTAVVKVDARDFGGNGGFSASSLAFFELVSVENLTSTPSPIPAPGPLSLMLLALFVFRSQRLRH